MWKCKNCEENINDRFKVCWNCGQPKIPTQEGLRYKAVQIDSKALKSKSLPKPESHSKIEAATQIKTVTNVESVVKNDVQSKSESTVQKISPSEIDFLAEYKPQNQFLSTIKSFLSFLLWLAAVVATAYFAYLSSQKMNNFEQQISREMKSFSDQKNRFILPPNPLADRKNRTPIDGNVKAKVLPINIQNKEVDGLYTSLPDDLRPANLDEVKTLMWLDCANDPVGRYKDGSVGYQENCKAFLVDRDSAKYIGIQEFIGVPLDLSKEHGNGNSTGKVSAEKYISYIREKQLESDRSPMQSSSDSPNHHFVNKSEIIYAIFALCVLGAVGLGWVAFKIKSYWASVYS